MTPSEVLVAVLLIAWAAKIAGASFLPLEAGPDRQARPRAREIVDAVALPLTGLTSKHRRADKLSTLRLILVGLLMWAMEEFTSPLNTVEGWIIVSIPGMLILDMLFAQVPAREFLAALTSVFGGMVAKRTSSRSTMTTTETRGEMEVPEHMPFAEDGALG